MSDGESWALEPRPETRHGSRKVSGRGSNAASDVLSISAFPDQC